MDAGSYLGLYCDAFEKRVVDASVWYLFSKTAVPKILKNVSNPFFVVCLRSPIHLAPSLHYQKLFTGHETISSFEDAWHLDEARNSGEFVGTSGLPPSADPAHMAYCHACLLGRQVERLLSIVDRKYVHFCFLEDLASDPRDSFADLCQFLELDEFQVEFRVSNKAKRWRNPLLRKTLDCMAAGKKALGFRKSTGLFTGIHHLNRKTKKYDNAPQHLVAQMRDAFRDDVMLLSRLTGRDLSHWLNSE